MLQGSGVLSFGQYFIFFLSILISARIFIYLVLQDVRSLAGCWVSVPDGFSPMSGKASLVISLIKSPYAICRHNFIHFLELKY